MKGKAKMSKKSSSGGKAPKMPTTTRIVGPPPVKSPPKPKNKAEALVRETSKRNMPSKGWKGD